MKELKCVHYYNESTGRLAACGVDIMRYNSSGKLTWKKDEVTCRWCRRWINVDDYLKKIIDESEKGLADKCEKG